MANRITLGIATIAVVAAGALTGYLAMTPRMIPDPVQASGPALAPVAQSTPDSSTGIEVSGEGRVRVKPDLAMANIGVDVTAKTLAEATSEANTKIAAVIAKLKSLGIADNDIQTVSYNVNPITQQPNQNATPAITGYHVGNQLQVTIRKIDDLGKILDAAVAAGANNIYGVSFGVANPRPYQEQARTAAVQDAQTKAGQLAKAASLQLGKVLSLSEVAVTPRAVPRAAIEAFGLGGGAVPVQTGELEIVVDVTARFAFK